MIIKIKTTSLRIGYICNNCAIFWTYLLIFICAINAIRVSFNKKNQTSLKNYTFQLQTLNNLQKMRLFNGEQNYYYGVGNIFSTVFKIFLR